MAKRTSKADEWFTSFQPGLWLKGDDTGRDEALAVKRLLHLRRGQRVLDCPCGAGRIAFHLATAGCKVTGVDRVASFIARARRRFRKARLAGEFLRCDMRKLDFVERFDAVVNFFGSFGYFSDAENLLVARQFAAALRPGGRLYIDQPNRERILRHFMAKSTHGAATCRTKWRNQRCETTWTLRRRGKTIRCRSVMRLYTPAQFRRLLARAGLTVENVYGGLDGSPYRRSSRRIVVVARKQQTQIRRTPARRGTRC